jgi:hypothetical protein
VEAAAEVLHTLGVPVLGELAVALLKEVLHRQILGVGAVGVMEPIMTQGALGVLE